MNDIYVNETLDRIVEGLQSNVITEKEAKLLISIILKKEISEMIKHDVRWHMPRSKKRSSQALFLNYTREQNVYG